jgi:hypothetical protein
MAQTVQMMEEEEEDEAFLRQLVLPEEERERASPHRSTAFGVSRSKSFESPPKSKKLRAIYEQRFRPN